MIEWPKTTNKALFYPYLLEVLYLGGSFALALKFGQWSYEGEMSRVCLRIISILYLIYFYRTYFYPPQKTAIPHGQSKLLFAFAITLLMLFAVAFTNAENESLTWQIVFAFSGILAGFREELFYRGIIQNHLQTRFPCAIALMIACAIFTLSHVQFIYYGQGMALVLIALAGVIFGCIYIFTGSVVFAATAHGLYDAVLCMAISPMSLSKTVEIPLFFCITLLFLSSIRKSLSLSTH